MLLIPPVILRQAPEPLPAHAHASLKEAKAASKASGHAIYAILAADDAGRDAALAFLGTPAANQARSHGEIWIPRIQDPEALRFRSERVTEPGTAVHGPARHGREPQDLRRPARCCWSGRRGSRPGAAGRPRRA